MGANAKGARACKAALAGETRPRSLSDLAVIAGVFFAGLTFLRNALTDR
jgi:hypothetical protein